MTDFNKSNILEKINNLWKQMQPKMSLNLFPITKLKICCKKHYSYAFFLSDSHYLCFKQKKLTINAYTVVNGTQ